MGNEQVRQGIVVSGTEQKVSPIIVCHRRADAGAIGVCRNLYSAHGCAGAKTVTARVAKRTIKRVVVVYRHPDVLVLVAEFERVLSFHPGKVHLWIEQRRILPLRIGALSPERAEVGD